MDEKKTLGYCPYCNEEYVELTEEHVIPQSIGGGGRTVIPACRSCNSGAGDKIDKQISQCTQLRLCAFNSPAVMNIGDKHQGWGRLKAEGGEVPRMLKGIVYFTASGDQRTLGFKPDNMQPDGTEWVTEHPRLDVSKVPVTKNIYRNDMLDAVSIEARAHSTLGLEQAMVKILLGIMYRIYGQKIIARSSFNSMRACLRSSDFSGFTFTWADSLDKRIPQHTSHDNFAGHTIWGSANGQTFEGGVSLFGTFNVEVTVEPFGQILHKQALVVPLNHREAVQVLPY